MNARRPSPGVLLTLSVALLGIALAVLAVRQGMSEPAGPELLLRDADGVLRIDNSKPGRAIVKGANLRPGERVRGRIVIENSGSMSAEIALVTRQQVGAAAFGGRSLTDALRLRVRAKTPRNQRRGPRTMYEGSLAGMPQLDLGEWRPGRWRQYTFRAKFSDGGPATTADSGDNLYQGASTRVTFVWRAQQR